MITYIKIDGFKSFVDFEMEFAPFTVIAGPNGSGKSNLFDALKLLSNMADKSLREAFTKQRGEAKELFTAYGDDQYASTMNFAVEMLVDKSVTDDWGGYALLKYTRLRYELSIGRKMDDNGIDDVYVVEESLNFIKQSDDGWVKRIIPSDQLALWRPTKRGRTKPFIYTESKNGRPTIKLPQDGKRGGKETVGSMVGSTVLSGVVDVRFPHAFAARQEIIRWQFLHLNPDDLRAPTKKELGMSDRLTQSGRYLASTLFRITRDKDVLRLLARQLNQLLPNITSLWVEDDQSNGRYILYVTDKGGMPFSSDVLSEGTLRLIALCTVLFDNTHQGLLCFEEPENGIHPFRIEALATLLKMLSVDFRNDDDQKPLRQIIVNTHSPNLVRQVTKWKDDAMVGIWFARQNALVADLNQDGSKVKIFVTRIEPVSKDLNTSIKGITSGKAKLTFQDILKYLSQPSIQEIENPI